MEEIIVLVFKGSSVETKMLINNSSVDYVSSKGLITKSFCKERLRSELQGKEFASNKPHKLKEILNNE